MPFNGAGVFTRFFNWATDAAAGIDILPARMDGDANDIAGALTNCVTRNGQSPATANLPMGGFNFTGLAAAVAAGQALTFDQAASSAGSALFGFIQGITGATTRTLQDKNRDIVSTFDFAGIDPTGAADSTAGFQAALTGTSSGKRILIIRAGTYKLGNISHGSFITVWCEPGAVFNFTGDLNTLFINIANQQDVKWYCNGALFNGNLAAAAPIDNGSQTCFGIYGSDNVLVRDANIRNFAFDGFDVSGDNSGSGPSTNVSLIGNDVEGCGRNALSVVHVDGLVVQGGRYWSSQGTPSGPWAGIDVEPIGTQYARNVKIDGVKTQDNRGAGLQFTPGAMSAGGIFHVEVNGGESQNDGLASTGSVGHAAVKFECGGALAGQIAGQISIRGFFINGPNAMGINVKNWNATFAPKVDCDGIGILNVNANAASTGNPNQTGIVVYCDASQADSVIGKLSFRNCRAEDNRGTPKMVQPAVVSADNTKTVQDVTFIDMVGVNYTASNKTPVNIDTTNAGTLVDVTSNYTSPKPVSLSSSVNLAGWGGQRINFTAGSLVATLEQAALCKSTFHEVAVDPAAGGNCTVQISGSDHIKANGGGNVTTFTVQPGDCLRLRSRGGLIWGAAWVA